MMKITAFNGSPRGRSSNTNVIIEAFLAGAKEAGAVTESVFLIGRDVKPCIGCFSCWFKTPGACVHHDDMDELIKLYVESDFVCFGTPVYTWNMTACLKNFVDRLIPLRCPTLVERDGNFDMEKTRTLPQIVIVANAGFPGDNNFSTMREVMKSAEPVLEIYRNCGMALRMQAPEVRARVDSYLDVVRRAGREIAEDGRVSNETSHGLEAELFSVEEYVGLITPKG